MKLMAIIFLIVPIFTSASDLFFTVSGTFGENGEYRSTQELPTNFLEEEQKIEKVFDITDGPEIVRGKFKIELYNSIEHHPKNKIVIFFYKYNFKKEKYELIDSNFYFFKDPSFWFVSETILSPQNSFTFSLIDKDFWE